MRKKAVLVLAVNPKDTQRLRLDAEMREIHERLRLAIQLGQLTLEQRWAVRPTDIQQAVLDSSPQIVHITGHGTGLDGICFEDGNGGTSLVSEQALINLFELFGEIECVLLNACYSEVQARAIAKCVAYVIGMRQAITDEAALRFSGGFYTAIGANKPIKFAYKMGCNALQLENLAELSTPVLITKDEIIFGDQYATDGVLLPPATSVMDRDAEGDSTEPVLMKLKLERDFNTYSQQAREQLFKAIGELLKVDGNLQIELVQMKRGTRGIND